VFFLSNLYKIHKFPINIKPKVNFVHPLSPPGRSPKCLSPLCINQRIQHASSMAYLQRTPSPCLSIQRINALRKLVPCRSTIPVPYYGVRSTNKDVIFPQRSLSQLSSSRTLHPCKTIVVELVARVVTSTRVLESESNFTCVFKR